MRLYLVRHAEVSGRDQEICRGRTDLALSANGWRQARGLAAAFRGLRLAAVYSSPSGRSMNTARVIGTAAGCDVVTLSDLAEIDFGAFEGRRFDEIALESPELFQRWMKAPTAVRFPKGESFGDLKARALSAVERLRHRHAGASIVAVSHAGPIRAILGHALGLADAATFRLDVSTASVSTIEWIDDRPVLRGLNLKMQVDVRTPT